MKVRNASGRKTRRRAEALHRLETTRSVFSEREAREVDALVARIPAGYIVEPKDVRMRIGATRRTA